MEWSDTEYNTGDDDGGYDDGDTIAIECVRQSSFLVQGRERFRSNEANEHTAEYGHKTKAATAKKK